MRELVEKADVRDLKFVFWNKEALNLMAIRDAF